MTLQTYASVLAKALRAGVRSIGAYGRAGRALSQPVSRFFSQAPHQAASSLRLYTPRIFGGLFMGSFAATAAISSSGPPDGSSPGAGSSINPLFRNPFNALRSDRPVVVSNEKLQQVDAALAKVAQDPMYQWTMVEDRQQQRRAGKENQPQSAADKRAEEASLLEFVCLGQAKQPAMPREAAAPSEVAAAAAGTMGRAVSAQQLPPAATSSYQQQRAAPASAQQQRAAPIVAPSAAPGRRGLSEDEAALLAFASVPGRK